MVSVAPVSFGQSFEGSANRSERRENCCQKGVKHGYKKPLERAVFYLCKLYANAMQVHSKCKARAYGLLCKCNAKLCK